MSFVAALPAIATIAGGIMNMMGQENTNDTNLQIQQNNSAFNAEQAQLNRNFQDQQAQRQMDWQGTMSSSSWQRGVQDMQLAGLNPMLAYSQGGASSQGGAAGSGSQASAGAPGNMVNPFAGAGQSAGQWAMIENTQADTRKKEAEAKVTESMMKGDEEPNAAGDKPTKSFPAASEEARSRQLHYQAQHEKDKIDVTKATWDLVKQEIKNAVAQERNIQADTRDTNANALLKELAKNEATNKSAHHLKYPTYNRDVKPFLEDANSTAHSAAAAIGKFRPSSKTFNIRNYGK